MFRVRAFFGLGSRLLPGFAFSGSEAQGLGFRFRGATLILMLFLLVIGPKVVPCWDDLIEF